MITSSHHIAHSLFPGGSPAALVGLFARAQLYICEEALDIITYVLADPLPALDYRLNPSLHLWIFNLAQDGIEESRSLFEHGKSHQLVYSLAKENLGETCVSCLPLCAKIHPVLKISCSLLLICRETLFFLIHLYKQQFDRKAPLCACGNEYR